MMKYLKIKPLIFIYFLILCTAFSGCNLIGRNEQVKISFPSVLAIDVSDNDEEMVKLTVASKEDQKPAGSSGGENGGGSSKTVKVKQSEGRTVFEADRALTSFSQKDIHWGQNEYIVIGEKAASDDVLKYLDFHFRNYETRLNVVIIIVKGANGEDLINELSTGEIPVPERILQLFDNDGALSLSKKITLLEFAQDLNSKFSSAIAPAVIIVEDPASANGEGNAESTSDDSEESNGGDSEKILAMNGYAVFKDTKLIGYIENEKARGFNWVTNNIRSSVIVVKDENDERVGLDVTKSKANIKTKINDDVPSVSINVSMKSNIGEMYGLSDIFNDKSLANLEAQQAAIVKAEIESVIEFAQENNVDIFGIGETIFRQNPVKWEAIKDDWDKIFPEIDIKVEVISVITRTYSIKKPVRNWEVEKEE